ncbi:ornithine cyclodeaminase [Oryzisolibacter propanilivorax]|uniref:Ornithine cyclodeaminase n=1 Tax=Oryzisolibacter propanilivorax TaxID=1527607 RepID=A0A1G9ULQ5_9BURK|nr:ornithine cyclodeaminase [Oryzisolibacter propanilivorax]SDM60811.1 ornithine cyclodeaminase [Oryzisolibacter propanilivorax]
MPIHALPDTATAPLTEFLSHTAAARLVARHGVLPTLRGMARAIEEDFMRWPAFDKSARVASHSRHGVIELMPVSDGRSYAFKYVNGHPGNPAHGLPTVMAFGALARVDTGLPEFLSELTLTTALRTAATSALVASRLVRPDSRSMALIGNGSQAEFQALAFHALLGIDQLRLFDPDPAAVAKLIVNLAPYDMELQPCGSTAEAVRGADIVTTLTAAKARAAVLQARHLAPGMHLNAVGGDCPGKTELAPQVLRRARVFVEYEPQTRIEGEVQQMPADFPVTEFWRVLTGDAPGRGSADEITLFDSVGFALEDFSALRYLRDLGRAAGLLEPIDLVAAPADPKNLYALLTPWLAQRGPSTLTK